MTQIRTGIDTPGSNRVPDETINESHIRESQIVSRHLHSKRGPLRYDKFLYNFAIYGSAAAKGGASGPITLTDIDGTALTLPAFACITRAFIEAVVATTSGGSATIKLGITGNDDCFVAATAMDNALFAIDAGNPTALTNEVPLKVGSSAVAVLATIATADLLAGTFVVGVEYTVGETV